VGSRPPQELTDYAASIGGSPDALRVVVLDAEGQDYTVLAIFAVLLPLFAVFLSIAIFLHRRAAKHTVELPTRADLTARDPAMTIVFSIVTCGLYELYWQYVTTRQLRRLTGRPDLQPVVDLLLSFVTLRLWTYWVAYRNAEAIDEAFAEMGEQTQHQLTALLLALGTWVCGLLYFAMIWKLQEAYNSFLIARILRDDALELIPSSPEDGLP
jgi:hypothetical protein